MCLLPCSHCFHQTCIHGLRAFSLKQVCPICRAALPPGPDYLYENALRRFYPLQRKIAKGEACWARLTVEQQKLMNEVIQMWRGAAEQGCIDAKYSLGYIYNEGQGVVKDEVEAVRWFRGAAELGDDDAHKALRSMGMVEDSAMSPAQVTWDANRGAHIVDTALRNRLSLKTNSALHQIWEWNARAGGSTGQWVMGTALAVPMVCFAMALACQKGSGGAAGLEQGASA